VLEYYRESGSMTDHMEVSGFAGRITQDYQRYKSGTPLKPYLPITLQSQQVQPVTGSSLFLRGLMEEDAVAVAQQKSGDRSIYVPQEYPFKAHVSNAQTEKNFSNDFLFRLVHPPTIEQVTEGYRRAEIDLITSGMPMNQIEAQLPSLAFREAVTMANLGDEPIRSNQSVALYNHGLDGFIFWDTSNKSFCIAGGAKIPFKKPSVDQKAYDNGRPVSANEYYKMSILEQQQVLDRLSSGAQAGGSCGPDVAFYFKVRKTNGGAGPITIEDQICIEAEIQGAKWESTGWRQENEQNSHIPPSCQTTRSFIVMPPWGTAVIPTTMYCSGTQECSEVSLGANVHMGKNVSLVHQSVTTAGQGTVVDNVSGKEARAAADSSVGGGKGSSLRASGELISHGHLVASSVRGSDDYEMIGIVLVVLVALGLFAFYRYRML
jgi:hypothetical protein